MSIEGRGKSRVREGVEGIRMKGHISKGREIRMEGTRKNEEEEEEEWW